MGDASQSNEPRRGRRAKAFAVVVACLLAICAAGFALYRAQGLRRGSIKTDLRVYAEPQPPPPLPRAGGKFFDPTFGTEIMRVTDEAATGGRNAGTSYSYWPTFNRDNTRLLVMRDAAPSGVVYEFDPVNFRLGLSYEVPLVPGTNGAAVRGDDAVWSSTDPETLYAHTGTRLYAFNARSRAFKVVGDLTRRLGAGESLYQMTADDSNDLFAFTRRGPAPAYAFLGYVVYQVSTDTVVRQGTGPTDECRIDKSGRYLIWMTGQQGRGKIEVRIVDVQTGATTDLTDDEPDHAPGHSDTGRGTVVGASNYLIAITARSLASPRRFENVFDLTKEKEYGAYHVSMRADDEGWALVSFYGQPESGVMRNEIVQIATDGSRRVRRLLHHRSDARSYDSQPRANVSRDGRYVAFTSNWGNAAGRRDLFVARIEPAPPRQVRPRRAP